MTQKCFNGEGENLLWNQTAKNKKLDLVFIIIKPV